MEEEKDHHPSRRRLLTALSFGAAAFANQANAKDTIPSRVMYFSNLSEVEAASVGADIGMIWISKRNSSDSQWYERATKEHMFLPSVRSGDGSVWQLLPTDYLNVRDFGAIGDGLSDDTRSIQAALDCAIYGENVPRTVYFPGGIYRTTDTLQVGYGESFVTAVLKGEAFRHPNGREIVNSLVSPDFWDRPCVNLQGGRRVHFQSLTLRGCNHNYISSAYELIDDRTNKALWHGPNLPQQADARTAPYAGICIDGYSGEKPADAYPVHQLPNFVADRSQYGRNFSSQTFIEDCQITGFCVGVMVQPGIIPAASNGDFLTLRDCDISFNITGIALANADARCNNILNCRLHFNHTSLDSVNYGNGCGNFMGHVAGSSFDNNVRIIDIDVSGHLPQGGGSPTFIDCYGESVYSLGKFIGTENAGPKSVVFINCKMQFSVKNREFSPTFILTGQNGIAFLHSCTFLGGFGLFAFDCTVDICNLVIMQPLAGGALGLNTEAGRAAAAYTCGIYAKMATNFSVYPAELIDISGVHGGGIGPLLAATNFPITFNGPDGPRPTVIPWWAKVICDSGDQALVSSPLVLRIDRAYTPVKNQSGSGKQFAIDFDLSENSVSQFHMIGVGDLVIDELSGQIFYIYEKILRGVDSWRLVLDALTKLRTSDHGQSYETDGIIENGHGVLRIETTRRFYPARRLAYAFAAFADYALALRHPVFTSQFIEPSFVKTGDLIVGAGVDSVPFLVAKVSGHDGIGVIKFGSPLMTAINGPCPLFVRELGG